MKVFVRDQEAPKKEKPKPLLAINSFNGYLEINVVKENGERITDLLTYDGYTPHCKNHIEQAGYSTDWADWATNGAFREMNEPLES
jgi:hypothetical protein